MKFRNKPKQKQITQKESIQKTGPFFKSVDKVEGFSYIHYSNGCSGYSTERRMEIQRKKKVLAYGEILWDLFPQGAVLGGAPFNVVFRLHTLGCETTLISRLGCDNLGHDALDQMRRFGMNLRGVQLDTEHATGTASVQVQNGQPEFHIAREVAYDYISKPEDLDDLTESIDCFYFGTLIQREPTSRETLYQWLAETTPTLRFLDLNLRQGCYHPTGITRSLEYATVLKLNEYEVLELARLLNLSFQNLPAFCKELMTTYGLKTCLVTLGEKGVFAMNWEETLYIPGYKVQVLDTVGSGDAFSAGFIFKTLQNKTLFEACFFGNLLGAAVATQCGATEILPQKTVDEIRQSDRRLVDPELIEHEKNS